MGSSFKMALSKISPKENPDELLCLSPVLFLPTETRMIYFQMEK